MRLQLAPLLAAALASALVQRSSGVPEKLHVGHDAGSAQNESAWQAAWGDSNRTWGGAVNALADVDAHATVQIHYVATALSNHSKKTLDGVLPQLSHVARQYGWCAHLRVISLLPPAP